jgi:hypothetical protein
MHDQESGEVCSVCKKPVRGGFDVIEGDSHRGFTVAIMGTADRDHNVCDACDETVHFKCSKHPETGYCDRCFEKYDLEAPQSAYGLHDTK